MSKFEEFLLTKEESLVLSNTIGRYCTSQAGTYNCYLFDPSRILYVAESVEAKFVCLSEEESSSLLPIKQDLIILGDLSRYDLYLIKSGIYAGMKCIYHNFNAQTKLVISEDSLAEAFRTENRLTILESEMDVYNFKRDLVNLGMPLRNTESRLAETKADVEERQRYLDEALAVTRRLDNVN